MRGAVDFSNVTCLLSKQFAKEYHNLLDIVPPYISIYVHRWWIDAAKFETQNSWELNHLYLGNQTTQTYVVILSNLPIIMLCLGWQYNDPRAQFQQPKVHKNSADARNNLCSPNTKRGHRFGILTKQWLTKPTKISMPMLNSSRNQALLHNGTIFVWIASFIMDEYFYLW